MAKSINHMRLRIHHEMTAKLAAKYPDLTMQKALDALLSTPEVAATLAMPQGTNNDQSTR